MKQYDFTQGSIFKQLIFFSTPILFTNLLQVSYQFIDSLWVGNLLGASALGAIAVSGTVIFTILSFIIGINNASLTILSQQKGNKDEAGVIRYLNAFVVILTSLAVLLGIIGYLSSEAILTMLRTPAGMLAEATIYLQINFIGILFLFGYNFIGTVMRAVGDSKTPLRFVVISVILNAILDPIFISTLDYGIAGAAYVTILSQGFAFLYGLFYILKKQLVPFTIPTFPKREEMRLIFKLGIPSGLQMMVISAGVMAIMSVVTSFGEDAVAGVGAAQRLDSVLMLPAMALGTAVSSIAGQNIGAAKWNRVHQIALYGVMYNFAIMFCVAVAIFFLAEQATRLFIQETDAVAFGTHYLQVVAFFFPFLGINFILNGVVRAAGAMFSILVLNIISFWVLRYPLTYLFANWFGEIGIGLGMGTSFVISSIIAFGYYRYGKWNEKKLFKNAKVS
ncbi:MATE family efflux transporter [Priestia megaterium]|nr:MATE family efflux transporter [Priestia megaterium]